MTEQAARRLEEHRNARTRQHITCAKLRLIVLINELDVADRTDADVNIQFEIARDPHIMEKAGGAK